MLKVKEIKEATNEGLLEMFEYNITTQTHQTMSRGGITSATSVESVRLKTELLKRMAGCE